MAVTEDMLQLAEEVEPEHCCLVPEKREELTTEGGLDVVGNEPVIKAACQRLANVGSEVSLFIDADKAQIDAAVRCGAPAIEIHTGAYADAENAGAQAHELELLKVGVEYALQQGLIVNAGHGLHFHNTEAVAQIPGINELNIGHSLMARALFVGLKEAVREMRELLEKSSAHRA